jgi:succinyl-diaminopimelate desuccinylase
MADVNEIFNYIEKNQDEMIELQRKLCAVPAIAPESGGDGEWEKAELLKRYLMDHDIKRIQQHNVPDKRVSQGKRPNLICTLPGKQEKSALWIMTHIDVVPPGEKKLWHHNPYDMQIKDGKLYGRGVEDNQQGLVSALFAFFALKATGTVPQGPVKLLFVADEETGSEYGIKYLLEKEKHLFAARDCVLVPDAGSKDGTMIEIAEKSILWLKFRILGVQCHASLPHLGKNAFLAASDLVLKLNALNQFYAENDPLFNPPVSTFSPTKKEGNVPNINTIPGEDVFYLDCRILPSIKLDDVLGKVKELCNEIELAHGVEVEMEIVQKEASPPTPENIPLVKCLKSAIHTVYNAEGKTVGIGGGTVGAHLRKKGIDTVVWATLDSTAHMPNEYCVIDNMIGDAKVMAHVMLSL